MSSSPPSAAASSASAPPLSSSSSSSSSSLRTALDTVDSFVEHYLKAFIQPFLKVHESFYKNLNKVLRKVLDDNAQHIPTWFTANFITYARTAMVIPTLVLLSQKHTFLPACIVLAVDLGDFLDGVVARYWLDFQKQQQEHEQQQDAGRRAKGPARPPSPDSDDDSFVEVLATGKPHSVLSWIRLHRHRSYGGFIDAVCDKAFLIPVWIVLLATVPESAFFHVFQYMTLFSLLLAETASGCVRFQAYFGNSGVTAPSVVGLDFSSSAVQADHVGKAKQTFEMVGTALYILPVTTYIGWILMMLAVPLAYESVRRKIQPRVLYIVSTNETLDHKTLKLWMQARALGSKLIVGITGEKRTDPVLNACAVPCVDMVIAEAPAITTLSFLNEYGINYIIIPATTSGDASTTVADDVIKAKKVLQLDSKQAVCRLYKGKPVGKKD